jgi:hypothetical protein
MDVSISSKFIIGSGSACLGSSFYYMSSESSLSFLLVIPWNNAFFIFNFFSSAELSDTSFLAATPPATLF